MYTALLPSPIGPLFVECDEDGALTRLYTDGHRLHTGAGPDEDGRFATVARQLDEYFAGERTEFDVPLAPRGTAFEQRVWAALQEIPHGATTTYGALAAQLGGGPRSARAVGRANARNPISIIVPCHRVIGADGSLTGYAGGLAVKRALLDHERGAVALAV